MNIHFTDIQLFNDLKSNTLATVKVGSHMYKLNNENSDIDYLSIYTENSHNLNSFMWEHHQLQYKENNTDYNFSSLHSFIRNTLTGDATINFEVIHSNQLIDTKLEWLHTRKDYFRNYNIIKSYLGLAKRDYKFWYNDTNKGTKHSTETHKKLSHFVRGIIFARNLLIDNFSLDLTKTTTFPVCGYDDYELLDRIKNGTLDYSFDTLTSFFVNLMNDTRNTLNEMHNARSIPMVMEVDKLREIDTLTRKTIDDAISKNLYYDNLFYDVLENGVSY